MAVEIKELIIRAVVDYPARDDGEQMALRIPAAEQEPSELIEACVKQVMKILKQKTQR